MAITPPVHSVLEVADTGSEETVSIDLPSSVEDNVIFAFVTHNVAFTATNTFDAAGWHTIRFVAGASGVQPPEIIAWKAMGATPDTSVDLDIGASGGYDNTALVAFCVVSGADTSTFMDVAFVGPTDNGTGDADSGPITPVTDGAYVLSVGLEVASAWALGSPPPGYDTPASGLAEQSTFLDLALFLAGKIVPTAGTEDPGAWNNTVTSPFGAASHTFAFRPASGSPPANDALTPASVSATSSTSSIGITQAAPPVVNNAGKRFVRSQVAARSSISNTSAADISYDTAVFAEDIYTWSSPEVTVSEAGKYLIIFDIGQVDVASTRAVGTLVPAINGTQQTRFRATHRYLRNSGGTEGASIGMAILDLADGDTVKVRNPGALTPTDALGNYATRVNYGGGFQMIKLPDGAFTHVERTSDAAEVGQSNINTTRPWLDNSGSWITVTYNSEVSDDAGLFPGSGGDITLEASKKYLTVWGITSYSTAGTRHTYASRLQINGNNVQAGSGYQRTTASQGPPKCGMYLHETGGSPETLRIQSTHEIEGGDAGTPLVSDAYVQVLELPDSTEWIHVDNGATDSLTTALAGTSTYYDTPLSSTFRADGGGDLSLDGANNAVQNDSGASIPVLAIGWHRWDRDSGASGTRKMPWSRWDNNGSALGYGIAGAFSRGQQGTDDTFQAHYTSAATMDLADGADLSFQVNEPASSANSDMGIYASTNRHFLGVQVLNLDSLAVEVSGNDDALTPASVSAGSSTSTVAIDQNHALAVSSASASGSTSSIAIDQDHAIAPMSVSAGSSTSATDIDQDHALSVSSVSAGSSVSSVAIDQDHVLTVSSASAGSQTSSIGIATQSTHDALTPQSVSAGSSVSSITIAQQHVLSPLGASASSSVSSIGIDQDHAVEPASVSAGSSTSAIGLEQIHDLTPFRVSAGSQVSAVGISQGHELSPSSVSSSGSTTPIGVAQDHKIAPLSASAGSQTSDVDLAQEYRLGVSAAVAASSTSTIGISTAAGNTNLAPQSVSTGSRTTSSAIAQDHALEVSAARAGASVSAIGINQDHELDASSANAESRTSAVGIAQKHAVNPMGAAAASRTSTIGVTSDPIEILITPASVSAGSSVSGIAISQEHGIFPSSVSSGARTSSADLAQDHHVGASSVSAASKVSAIALSQDQVLVPGRASAGSSTSTIGIEDGFTGIGIDFLRTATVLPGETRSTYFHGGQWRSVELGLHI